MQRKHFSRLKYLLRRKYIVPIALLVLAILVGVGAYRIHIASKRIWSVNGQIMMELAQDEWKKGQIPKAIEHWWSAVQLTISDTVAREEAYEYLRQSDNLLQQGKLTDALDICRIAAKIYDEEGATTYRCLQIQQWLYGTPTPFAVPSPTPIVTSASWKQAFTRSRVV